MDEPIVPTQEPKQSTTQSTTTVSVGAPAHDSPGVKRSDISRIALGWFITIGFFSVLIVLLVKYDILLVKDILLIMLGVLCAKFSTVVDFDFGGSASSNAKTQLLANKP